MAKNGLWYKVIQKQSNSSYPDAFLVIHSSDHFDTHLGNLGEIWLFYTDVTENFYDSFPDTNTGVLLKQQCNLQIHYHNFFVTTHKSKLTKRYTHLFLNTIISASLGSGTKTFTFFSVAWYYTHQLCNLQFETNCKVTLKTLSNLHKISTKVRIKPSNIWHNGN